MRILTALTALTAAAGLALAGCGGNGETSPAQEPATNTTAAATQETETSTADAEAAVVRVENGEPVGGRATIKVKHGDHVSLRIEVDEPQQIHVHGYDLEREATPAKPAVFSFTADLEGIFEVESHLKDVVLAQLVVEP